MLPKGFCVIPLQTIHMDSCKGINPTACVSVALTIPAGQVLLWNDLWYLEWTCVFLANAAYFNCWMKNDPLTE